MTEIWRKIKDFEGYEVSNLGRVKSLNYNKTKKSKILKVGKSSGGYLQVQLCNSGRSCKFIHRLVAEAFISNPDNLPQINHKDEDITNNNADNLEWCTARYNANYGTRNNRMTKSKSKVVLQFDLNGSFITEYPSTAEVERQLGFAHTNINSCCNGKYKTAYGYIWRYK